MPAPLNIDREQVRMLVLSIGVREAARKLNIAEGTVQAWSKRFGWIAATRPVQPTVQPPPTMRPVSVSSGATIATKAPADLLSEELRNMDRETRINGARAVSRALGHAATLKPGAALKASRHVKDHVSAAATLHGWDAGRPGVAVQINLLGGE